MLRVERVRRRKVASRGRVWRATSAMNDVTRILSAIERGDPSAADQLLPLVYDELRKLATQRLAHEKPGQTLQATALVHEAYLKLVGTDADRPWNGRDHFFAAAAEAMRRLLIDNARRKQTHRHGGLHTRRDIDAIDITAAPSTPTEDLLALDEALTRLEAEDPPKAQLVKLRYFAGLTEQQAADAAGLSLSTAQRHWRFARAWLLEALHEADDSENKSEESPPT